MLAFFFGGSYFFQVQTVAFCIFYFKCQEAIFISVEFELFVFLDDVCDSTSNDLKPEISKLVIWLSTLLHLLMPRSHRAYVRCG